MAEALTAEARGDTAERMVYAADRLVRAVHDRGVESVRAVVEALDGEELVALAVVLAGMVNPVVSVSERLDWVRFDEHGKPLPPVRHGEGEVVSPVGPRAGWSQESLRRSHAAYSRGMRSGPVVAGEQEYQRRRGARRRASTGLTVVPASE